MEKIQDLELARTVFAYLAEIFLERVESSASSSPPAASFISKTRQAKASVRASQPVNERNFTSLDT